MIKIVTMEKRDLRNCVITGLPTVGNKVIYDPEFKDPSYFRYSSISNYEITIAGKKIRINVAADVFVSCYEKDDRYEEIEANRGQLIGYFLQDIKSRLDNKTIYWELENEDKNNQVVLKRLIEDLKKDDQYPKTRKEKYDKMLVSLRDMLSTEESEIGLTNGIELYGRLYFRSYEEFQLYLSEAIDVRKHLRYNDQTNKIQFRISGLEYVEQLKMKSVETHN
jgi:hypothetical protein